MNNKNNFVFDLEQSTIYVKLTKKGEEILNWYIKNIGIEYKVEGEYYELRTETLFMMFKYSKANFHDLVDGQILIPKKHLKEQTYQNDEQNKTMKKK